MSETIASIPSAVPLRVPGLDGLLRGAVRRALRGLRSARVAVHEDGAVRTLGGAAGAPSVGLHVDDPRFWRTVALGGSLGAAEAYIRGWWSSDDLVGLLRAFAREAEVGDELERGAAQLLAPLARLRHRLRRNSRTGSRRNIVAHYDLGNDFFRLFLDETLTYSSAYFARPEATLAEASTEKLDRLCRALRLAPHHRLLEIGTGWGSLAMHAASRYGCRVVTTTISPSQRDLAAARIAAAGLADRIEVRLEDYRDLRGTFDRIVSIEMIEAVGHEYLPEYFGACGRLLAPDGAMALQAITMPDHRYEQYLRSVDFIRAFVFPGSCVPSPGAMRDAMARSSDLRIALHEDIGLHYAETLRRWRAAFLAQLDAVRALGHDDAFIRLWDYYLAYCEAGFAERAIDVAQLILVRPGAHLSPSFAPGGSA